MRTTKRLTLTYRNKVIVSDAFNFKAYRAVRASLAARFGDALTASDSAALEGVIALFDGSALTEDTLRHSTDVDPDELAAAERKILDWFFAVNPPARKFRAIGRPPEDVVLALYNTMLTRFNRLPAEVDMEDPQLLLDVLAADTGDAVSEEQIPAGCGIFYGL